MPINLTRLDNFPGGWNKIVAKTWENYQDVITLADQDILNIIFNQVFLKNQFVKPQAFYRYIQPTINFGSFVEKAKIKNKKRQILLKL